VAEEGFLRRAREGAPASQRLEYCPGFYLADQKDAPFHHRSNEDGTFTSICARCFRTVAFGVSESKLAEEERHHVCEERFNSVKNPEDRRIQSVIQVCISQLP
jgi:hypothetical protein